MEDLAIVLPGGQVLPSGGLPPEVALQAGWREGKAFRLGDGHHGAGIGGGVHLELEGRIGFHLGEKRRELGFGHGFFSYFETLGRSVPLRSIPAGHWLLSAQISQAGPPALPVYLWLGVEPILLGPDHLLFVLGLLLIVGQRWRVLIKTITALTVAHSLTLAATTLGAWGVRTSRGQTSLTIRHPWLVAFAFGLLHGVGLATALQQLGLPKGETLQALALFNLAVELGQLVFVAAVWLAIGHWLGFRAWPWQSLRGQCPVGWMLPQRPCSASSCCSDNPRLKRKECWKEHLRRRAGRAAAP